MDLVSIIVPVYNVERYLEECVQSLVKQSYSDIEIILVDDGSKDSSGKMCDQFEKEDSRIKVIHKENAGLGFARNSGLDVAKGKYVTFIDSDDVADENLIENLIQGIHENNADTCIGGFKRITENGKIVFQERYNKKIYAGLDVYQELFARMLGSDVDKHDAIRMSVWNVLYSMEIIKANTIRFPSERVLISEDIIWDSEYYRYSKLTAVIESTAYKYRITPGSLTQKYKPDKFEMICNLYNVLCEQVEDNLSMKTRLQRQFFVNLRDCIHQEKQSVSKNSKKIYRDKVEKIINNATVEQISKEYPINRIQLKPRVFILLVKYKLTSLIMILNDCNVI